MSVLTPMIAGLDDFGGAEGGPGTDVVSVTVSPAAISVVEGGIALLTAVARNAQGQVLSLPVSWSSDDEAVAIVSAAGTVTGVAEGNTTVTATVEGVSDSATVVVVGKPDPNPCAGGARGRSLAAFIT